MCVAASIPCPPRRRATTVAAPALRAKTARPDAFSLVELLVVLAIMAILLSLILVSISGIKGSRDLANAAYSIQGSLEQARTYAMSENTYTWVGFFEENPASPGTAGTGQVVISIVASASGTNLVTASNAPQLPSASLLQISKLMKIPNVHLDVVPTAAVTRPAIATASPADTYQLGSADFPNPSTNSWKFLYPVTASSSSSAQYTFTQVIQFSPQGDATRIGDTPTTLMEVGLQPTHGGTITASGENFAVLQVTGIGGQVISYRP
jgi:prepilin-type N-terminal cleavage/methylation domain-containing protein